MDRAANEVFVQFGAKLSALLDPKSKHSLDDVTKGLTTLVVLLTSIVADPTNEGVRAVNPASKSLARLFTLLDRHYLMALLKGQPKVVCFKESIYFGLDDVDKLNKFRELAIKHKAIAEDKLKERGERCRAWRRKKEKEQEEMRRLKLAFYDDRDIRDLSNPSLSSQRSRRHDGRAMGNMLKVLGKEKQKRHEASTRTPPKEDIQSMPKRSTRLPTDIPSLADF